MQYFDSHAHLSDLENIDAIMQRAIDAKVTKILNICIDPMTLSRGIELKKRFPDILFNAGSTTPHDVEKEGEYAFKIFEKAAYENVLSAIGETGLDYHYQFSDRALQRQFLIKYLHLAVKTQLPLIFHCRNAFEDLFQITDAELPKGFKAILHCFTGTMQEAHKVIERGWYLSLSGIVTFKKSYDLKEIAKIVPLNQLLIETDAPYLAPQSKRGQPNEPSFIHETAKCIADLKEVSLHEVVDATYKNACNFLKK
jgi:TatD DNase family protein